MPAGRPPKAETKPKRDRGYEFIIFVSLDVDQDLRYLSRVAHRSLQEIINYFLWLAEDKDLCRRKIAGVKVEKPNKRMTWYSSPARRQRCIDLAWDHGVYRDSVQHYCGLAIELAIRTRPVEEWVPYFMDGEDLVDRVVDFLADFR